MIKVLIVEDSISTCKLMKEILNSDPLISVIGTVGNGKDAVDFVARHKPDVVTMDINLPVMDGATAIQKIMGANPLPIIIVSDYWEAHDSVSVFKAMEIGAVAVLNKPRYGADNYRQSADKLVSMVKLMSEIKVIKRLYPNFSNTIIREEVKAEVHETKIEAGKIDIVAVGASTGGPVVIEKILSNLRRDFRYPIVVVQHITPGFLDSFVEWLKLNSKIGIRIAVQDEILKPGYCYLAPDNYQMSIMPGRKVRLTGDNPVNGLRPSVSYMFSSLARYYSGSTLAILLTGMGKDGAEELKTLREKGGITIAQDEFSSVVHGMPGEAIKLGGAQYIFNPEKIIFYLNNII